MPKSIENDRSLALSGGNPFNTEVPLYRKEHNSSDISVTVVVPDPYHVAFPNLGHQMVEHQLNQIPGYYADRAYLDTDYSLLKEKPHLNPEVVFLSMSYEGSYIRSLRALQQMGIPLRSRDRQDGDPVIVCGGWSVSRNPLPLFEIADVIGIGDSEHMVGDVATAYRDNRSSRSDMFETLTRSKGIVIPSHYDVATENGYLTRWEPRNAPNDIYPSQSQQFPHSWYLSPDNRL